MHFTMAIFVEHIWPMIFFIFCFLMGPIWSLTVFRCAVFSSWIIYAPWLFWVVPVMCHGSYMIHDYFYICCICYNYLRLTFYGSYMPHDCSELSLLYVMGPIWSIITFSFVAFVIITWAFTFVMDHISFMPALHWASHMSRIPYDPWLFLYLLPLLYLLEPSLLPGSYRIHESCKAPYRAPIYNIWSMTALHGALHIPWITYCPWLLYTEPCMSHGSYMIHKCSTRSLTRIMDPIWSMTALHGAYSWCYWVLSDSISYVQYSIPGIWLYLNSISCFTSSTCLHKSYYSQISSRSGALFV